MKNKLTIKKADFLYASILCIFVTACGDNSLLQAVKNFTSTRSTISKTVTMISEDFYKSCVRQYSFLPIEPNPTILQQITPYQKRIEGLKKCNEQWRIAENFQKSNDILLKYIGALEAISSDNVVIFPDTTKDKLVNALNRLPLDNSKDPDPNVSADRQQAVKAGVGLLQFISKVFLNKFRENQLSEVIVDTNDDVQSYVLILKKSVQRGYIEGYLQQEQDNIDRNYNLIVTDLLHKEFPNSNIDPNKPPEKLAFDISSPFYSVDNEWRDKRSEVNKNIEIGRLYIQLLDEVAQGHNELYVLIKGKPTEGLVGNQAPQNNQKQIKELAQRRIGRIQDIAKKLENELAK